MSADTADGVHIIRNLCPPVRPSMLCSAVVDRQWLTCTGFFVGFILSLLLHRGPFLAQLSVLARADAVHCAPRFSKAHPEAGHCDSMRKLACQPSCG